MANNKSSSRDLGLNHGAGKGDSPRSMSADYYRNFEEIRGLYGMLAPGRHDGFEKTRGNRWRKIYR